MISKIAEFVFGFKNLGEAYLDDHQGVITKSDQLAKLIQLPIHNNKGQLFDPKKDPVGWFGALPDEYHGTLSVAIRDNPIATLKIPRHVTQEDHEASIKAWDTRGRRTQQTPTADEENDTEFKGILNDLKSRSDLTTWERENIVPLARAYQQSYHRHPGSSISNFMGPNGGFTADRTALHDKILAEYAAKYTEPHDNPVGVIMGGLPGSGKSGLIEDEGIASGYLHIDSDEIKEKLPEWDGGSGAAFLHEESRYLGIQALKQAAAAHQNIVMNATMRTQGDAMRAIKMLADNGYKTNLIFADISIPEAIMRTGNRYMKRGRFVPPDYIRASYSPTSKSTNYDAFLKLRDLPQINNWHLYNTEGTSPKLVASK